ncbi:alpha/beta hydrolase [Stenotrophomonas sp. MMGLT7]|uniref:alpha/beta hydrolase n=1 Tax=Stenotrophomonas sp. MMGLT7 TaxID=2901227 RepID=UPI001E62E6C6|nr:alpha/beta hydrolase [Stenotrophomonas sp. MMGLT7]MCD7098090.1 alpha/beta hydrolase [Stenotrophomonas sp. MMGLT7]
MPIFVPGPAGKLQIAVDMPAAAPRGIALVSHPQPLLGGSPRHIVPYSAARRLRDAGWIAVRPSFRGVEGSEGEYDHGVGETEDTLAIAAHLRQQYPGLPLALVGFSFGAYVYARAACRLEATAPAAAIALMGLPVGTVPRGRDYEPQPLPDRALLLHGQDDDFSPLANVLEWAAGRQRPVVVFAGTDHFFKGCLPRALDTVVEHVQRAVAV